MSNAFEVLRNEMDELVIGHDDVKTALLLGVIAREHIYIQGPPGTAKTMLSEIISKSAELKFFITAKAEIRAQRRFDEMKKTGVSFQEVLDNLLQRDEKDSSREINPLRVAKEAIVIDNSEKTENEQNNLIFEIVKKKIANN